jgi:hypothetical protein
VFFFFLQCLLLFFFYLFFFFFPPTTIVTKFEYLFLIVSNDNIKDIKVGSDFLLLDD